MSRKPAAPSLPGLEPKAKRTRRPGPEAAAQMALDVLVAIKAGATSVDISKNLGASFSYIAAIADANGLPRPPSRPAPVVAAIPDTVVKRVTVSNVQGSKRFSVILPEGFFANCTHVDITFEKDGAVVTPITVTTTVSRS